MKVNWDQGFARIRWAFIGISWLIFFAAQIGSSSTAAQVGEYSVYMLFFTGGVVIFARVCIWVVRGFIGRTEASSQLK